MSRILIINADDLGEPKFSDAILDGLTRKLMTSATVLVGRSSARRSIASALELGAGLGLHVNLTAGAPVAPPTAIPSIVDATGVLLGKPEFEHRLELGRVEPSDIRIECEAQLELFRELAGDYPAHIDGHHHVQARPRVAAELGPLLGERGIQRMRLPIESSEHFSHLEPERERWASRLVLDAVKSASTYRAHKLRWPYFVGIGYGWSDATYERVISRLGSLPQGVSEYMVHVLRPGEVPSSDPASERAREWRLLASPAFRAAIRQLDIRLGNYADL